MNNRLNRYIDRIRNLNESQRKLLINKITGSRNSSLDHQKTPILGVSAYLVLHQGEDVETGIIYESISKILPEYMIPSDIIVLDSLPLGPTGKIDKKKLALLGREHPPSTTTPEKPVSPVEKALQHIWQDLLNKKQIGINENFFHLGGHSLLATQLISRINSIFHLELPLLIVFENPTIKALGTHIMSARKKTSDSEQHQIAIASRDVELPLSFAQQRLWFLEQLIGAGSLYTAPQAFILRGTIDYEILKRCINEIIQRHEILRTSFKQKDGVPVQQIKNSLIINIIPVNLRNLPENKRMEEVNRQILAEVEKPFDLENGPLIKVKLWCLSAQRHVLFVSMHHIVFDGWSTEVFNRELSLLYTAYHQSNHSPLPDLPIQYVDFAVWQREWLQSEKLEKQVSFWKNHLKDIAVLELPTDRRRPAVQTFNGEKHIIELPRTLIKKLHILSINEGATLFMTLLTAFQAMLHRYTGQNDIAVGTTIANRQLVEIEELIGFFANTLVVRSDTSGNPTFRELLVRVKKVLLDAYAHQDLPFEKLVEELQPKRDLSRNPLFQVLFAMRNVSSLDLKFPHLHIRSMDFEFRKTRFDLEVHMMEDSDSLMGVFLYNTDLFDDDTIERMGGHFQRIIEGVAAAPDQKISDLPLMTDREHHRLLVEWNKTAKDYPRHKCIHEMFKDQVEKNPESVAVTFGKEKLTYRELNDKANQLGNYLMGRGVGPDVPVAICMDRSSMMVIGILGILLAGGAYVPLDPAYPQKRLSFMLKDSKAQLLLTQTDLSRKFSENKPLKICLDETWDDIKSEISLVPQQIISPENLAYILYTSGSTGKPKGIAMPHRPLSNLISWQINSSTLSSGAKTLQFASLSFDVSFQEIFATLCSGGNLVVIPEELHQDPVALLNYLAEQTIERLFLPFVALQQLAELADSYNILPQSLLEVITAGEQLRITPSIVKMFQKLENCRLFNQYGPTESHVVTEYQLSDKPDQWPSLPSIGRPIANVNIYILDPNCKSVPIGVVGELYVGGACLARQYLNQSELTNLKFIRNPFSKESADRLYKTGDLVRYLPNGNIEYLGRIDQQLKVRGFRIESGEIETVLGHHTNVRDVVVTASPDNSGNYQLIAYIVLNEKSDGLKKELRNYLLDRLPDYMIPSVFILLEALPLTPSGKVDRKALPAPEADRTFLDTVFVEPQKPTEKILAAIWCEVLKIQYVGIEDNFFELGGHSLLATKAISRIRDKFQLDVPLRIVFEHPTISSLAEHIENKKNAILMSITSNQVLSDTREEFTF